jgi:hypothetical protein
MKPPPDFSSFPRTITLVKKNPEYPCAAAVELTTPKLLPVLYGEPEELGAARPILIQSEVPPQEEPSDDDLASLEEEQHQLIEESRLGIEEQEQEEGEEPPEAP